MRFAFIDEHKQRWPVEVMCHVLAVSCSGYYAWCKRGVSSRVARRAELAKKIKPIFEASRGTYGSPRVHRELVDSGEQVDRKTVAKVMKQAGFFAASPRSFVPATTDSKHDLPIAPNRLNQDFEASAPNQKWCADITYVWTDQGWLFLACIIDCFSRMIVGWSMSSHLGGSLVNAAMRMALERRQPVGGLIHHSDRGCQYAARIYQTLLSSCGVQASMSRVGCCYDNAMMESFFATLKRELVHRRSYKTREEAATEIFKYIEGLYNRKRRHSSLGYLSPQAFEAQLN
jgi:transposase InsO family protein